MLIKDRALALGCLLLVLGWAGTAQAQYRLTGPTDGGQLQIGSGLPLPGQVFTGGTTVGQAGTFPPLLVPPAPVSTIGQDLATSQGGAIAFPPAVLQRIGNGTPVMVPTFPTNPAVFQVNTSIDFTWPATAATLAPGGGPGPIVLGGPGSVGTTITYSGGTKAFGGPAQFAVSGGVGAAGGAVPGIPVTVYINFQGMAPGTATMAAIVGASVGPLGQPGASVAAPGTATSAPPLSMGFMNGSFGPAGTVLASVQVTATGLTNMVTSSKGFPWTTGLITLSQPAAMPPEVFFLSGTDMRVAGVGNIQMVSGALSTRNLSGPNGNRGWLSLTLPEPTLALGAAGALAMLGACHGLVRRRR